MNYVFDTSIYIEFERNNTKQISELNDIIKPGSTVHLTTFSYSEILYGVLKKGDNLNKKIAKLNLYPVLNTTTKSSYLFSKLKLEQKKIRKQIPLFDLLIASVVVDSGFTLITLDNHFKEISGLKTIIL